MAFDFSNVVNTATEISKTTTSDKVNYPYPLVYPTPGQTLMIKLLYNPQSKSVVRLVNRHEKIPCYRTYGIECPICKVMQQVIDTTGQDPFGKSKSKARGVSFAWLISCTKPIEYNNKKIAPGDTILFMYPWSVYQQINQAINALAAIPSNMERAFCSADQGLYIQVSVSDDYKYTTTVVPFMTFASGMTDEQFMKYLEDMPNLSEQVVPSKIDEKVDSQVKEYTDNIYREFIAPRVPNQTPIVNNYTPVQMNNIPMGQVNTVSNPMNNAAVVTPIQGTVPINNSKPVCFGKYVENQPTCICCPYEVECMTEKNKTDDEIPF